MFELPHISGVWPRIETHQLNIITPKEEIQKHRLHWWNKLMIGWCIDFVVGSYSIVLLKHTYRQGNRWAEYSWWSRTSFYKGSWAALPYACLPAILELFSCRKRSFRFHEVLDLEAVIDAQGTDVFFNGQVGPQDWRMVKISINGKVSELLASVGPQVHFRPFPRACIYSRG